MIAAAGDGAELVAAVHRGRHEAARGGAIAELAGGVVAPAVRESVAGDGAVVRVAWRHEGPGVRAPHLLRRRAAGVGAGGIGEGVDPPAIDGLVDGHATEVRRAAAERREA